MSKLTPFILIVVFITLSSLPSCRKVSDYIHGHPDAHDSLCRIIKMSVSTYYSANLYTFSYNKSGDPISILDTNRIGTNGNDDQYFRYDRSGRLTDHVLTFIGETDNVIAWHKYGYPRNNFITDTAIYYFGEVTKPAPNAANAPNGYSIFGYTLDVHGRIIQYWSLPKDPHQTPPPPENVTYDANGNLTSSNPERYYDDKVNVYRTNKVWQFVYGDYSRNNLLPRSPSNPVYPRVPDPVYNDFGLPLLIPNSFERTMGLFGMNNIAPVIELTYACRISQGPINY